VTSWSLSAGQLDTFYGVWRQIAAGMLAWRVAAGVYGCVALLVLAAIHISQVEKTMEIVSYNIDAMVSGFPRFPSLSRRASLPKATSLSAAPCTVCGAAYEVPYCYMRVEGGVSTFFPL